MGDKEQIEDSLEFCRDIKLYHTNFEVKESSSPYIRTSKDSILVPSAIETETFIKLYGEPEELGVEQLNPPYIELSPSSAETPLRSVTVSPSYPWTGEDSDIKDSFEQTEKMPKKLYQEVFSMAIYLIAAFILAKMLTTYVGHHTIVEGHSMENTLSDRDVLIIDRLTYHFKAPERFDIIIFPYTKDTYYIKRVIGLPGETLQIIDSQIYINGEVIDDIYAKDNIFDSGIAYNEVHLKQDEYFVMGDNRNNSKDSRSEDVGVINRKDLKGRAILRILPFKQFGALK